jgi:hypothetical protein
VALRKDLKPGDLVIGQVTTALQQDTGIMTRMGMIISVRYPRDGAHIGCEDRIKVMWCDPIRFDEVCDCNLVCADQF